MSETTQKELDRLKSELAEFAKKWGEARVAPELRCQALDGWIIVAIMAKDPFRMPVRNGGIIYASQTRQDALSWWSGQRFGGREVPEVVTDALAYRNVIPNGYVSAVELQEIRHGRVVGCLEITCST